MQDDIGIEAPLVSSIYGPKKEEWAGIGIKRAQVQDISGTFPMFCQAKVYAIEICAPKNQKRL